MITGVVTLVWMIFGLSIPILVIIALVYLIKYLKKKTDD